MKNIHVIQTDKPSKLCKNNNKFHYVIDGIFNLNKEKYNIYITSDEEIKERDWGLSLNVKNHDLLFKAKNIKYHKTCKKIILTTDQDLIKDGVQEIPDEFLEWFVKNPSCEYVDINKIYNDYKETDIFDLICTPHSFKYKIIIPKEEHQQEFDNSMLDEKLNNFAIKHNLKQETLEEATKFYRIDSGYRDLSEEKRCKHSFKEGAKWLQEKSYSEEEVLELTNWYLDEFLDDSLGLNGKEAEKKVEHLKGKGLTKEVLKYWSDNFKKK